MRMNTDWVDVTEAHQVPKEPLDPDQLTSQQAQQLTWLGHSCFLVQTDGMNVLTDPVFSDRASPVSFAGPKRYTPTPINVAQLPPIHAVIISHNHYDHLDVDTISAIESKMDPLWFVPLKNGPLLVDAGVDASRVIELDWWQSHQTPLGFHSRSATFIATPAQHWSARGLFDRNEMLWSSWAVYLGDFRFYFGGDTGYHSKIFKEIGKRVGPFDLGIIPIGAYAPREFMAPSHVQPEESVLIHLDIRSRRSIGAHWGTFPLTAEPVMEPKTRLKKALEHHSLHKQSFIAPVLGKRYSLDGEKTWGLQAP